MDNPGYPLELFQRVITVSLEAMKIARSLPKLNIDTGTGDSKYKNVRTLLNVQNCIKAQWGDAPAAAYTFDGSCS